MHDYSSFSETHSGLGYDYDLDGSRAHPNQEFPVWDGNPKPEIPDLDTFRNGTYHKKLLLETSLFSVLYLSIRFLPLSIK
jgi:hypothetical protein